MPYKTPNPVQKIQGFVEVGSETVMTTGQQNVRVPTTYPNARIEFFHAGTNERARFYNQNGEDQEVNSIEADQNGFYSFFAETGRYALKFFNPAQTQQRLRLPKNSRWNRAPSTSATTEPKATASRMTRQPSKLRSLR